MQVIDPKYTDDQFQKGQSLQDDIHSISDWMQKNKLKMNEEQT